MKNKNLFVLINEKGIKVKEGIKYEDKDFCIISNHTLYDLKQNKINLKKIIYYYKKNIDLANVITNTFTIIIIDKNNNQVICYQDINGDSIPLYFYKRNNAILFTNKIINIVSCFEEKFEINKSVISVFIKKGYIPNKNTLISGIYKVIPKYNLIYNINNKKVKFVKKKIKYNKVNKSNTELYINDFKKIIHNKEKNKNVFITLSNGYDSNFIYSFLNKNKYIEAFTVGGISGRDETKDVYDNIKEHKNTHLNISYVNEQTLDKYVELVYLLEGSMYEKGIFLQYELMNTIREYKNDDKVIFLGEGADQIFSCEYYNKLLYVYRNIRYIINRIKKNAFFDELFNLHIKGGLLYRVDPYQFLTYIILKKNGILMNNINMIPTYPYLYKNIIDIAYINRYKNINKKQTHIEACEQEIELNIIKNITKVGGATDPVALFKNCPYIKEIEKLVNNSKYNILKIKKNSYSNDYLDYILKVLYLEIFEYLFIDNNADINDKKNKSLIEILELKNN